MPSNVTPSVCTLIESTMRLPEDKNIGIDETLQAGRYHHIADDFKPCVRAKIMVAQGSCNGPTCTLECKTALLAAIGTLDGSCCEHLGMGVEAAF